jgi:hypothetical protein
VLCLALPPVVEAVAVDGRKQLLCVVVVSLVLVLVFLVVAFVVAVPVVG